MNNRVYSSVIVASGWWTDSSREELNPNAVVGGIARTLASKFCQRVLHMCSPLWSFIIIAGLFGFPSDQWS